MKYDNRAYNHDGIKFRSEDEIRFYKFCWDLKAKGEIDAFEYNTEKYNVIPKFRFEDAVVNPIQYVPDFILYMSGGTKMYVEVKGFLNSEAKLKVKLFKWWLKHYEPESRFMMLSRSLKYGTWGEWIPYETLMAIRRENKRKKGKTEKDKNHE